VNDGLVDGLVFLDFHLSRGVIIALLMRSKNQNAYPLLLRQAVAVPAAACNWLKCG
jgi:hypothetical protein